MSENNDITNINEGINLVDYSVEEIEDLIYTIRGKQVMLDSDVANLYHYTTKNINKAVKRNIERFPEEFCFQLKEQELENMRFQIGTSKRNDEVTNVRGGRRYLPYVFTEQGIAMLSGLLKNDIAVQVSINIMNAFVSMRRFLLNNGQVFQRLTNVEYTLLEQGKVLSKHEKQFKKVFDELQKNKKEEFKQKIFFDGQIYDAYSLIIDIIKMAKSKILIIDNYIDDSILQMLSKKNRNVEVIVLTSPKCKITKLDINKFNKQYPSIKIVNTNKFHDRFIVIDDKELYHCGASLKDLGKKCFAISKMLDTNYIKEINKVC